MFTSFCVSIASAFVLCVSYLWLLFSVVCPKKRTQSKSVSYSAFRVIPMYWCCPLDKVVNTMLNQWILVHLAFHFWLLRLVAVSFETPADSFCDFISFCFLLDCQNRIVYLHLIFYFSPKFLQIVCFFLVFFWSIYFIIYSIWTFRFHCFCICFSSAVCFCRFWNSGSAVIIV